MRLARLTFALLLIPALFVGCASGPRNDAAADDLNKPLTTHRER